MKKTNHRVCPASRAGHLDSKLRFWFQNPYKILNPYVREGMAVLDVGCGPGFFSIPMARMVGERGRVVACDLQAGMLKKLADKIEDTDIQERIVLHQCEPNRLGLSGTFDFVLAFYMIHELPDRQVFFDEMKNLIKPDGKILMVEPPFHVSRSDLAQSLKMAKRSGFRAQACPQFRISKAVLFQHGTPDSSEMNSGADQDSAR